VETTERQRGPAAHAKGLWKPVLLLFIMFFSLLYHSQLPPSPPLIFLTNAFLFSFFLFLSPLGCVFDYVQVGILFGFVSDTFLM
jgi:hypothetical protein